MTNDLLIHEPLPPGDLLAEWRWKVGGAATLLHVSRSGDAFGTHPDGHVWWLDTGGGELAEVAGSVTAFEALINDAAVAARLLLSPVVMEFVRLHGPFPVGRCLGYTMLPVLGGTYTVENRWLAPIHEHFGVTGELHRQLRDFPDGTPVQIRLLE